MSNIEYIEKVGASLILSAALFIVAYSISMFLPGHRVAILVTWGISAVGIVLLAYGGARA